LVIVGGFYGIWKWRLRALDAQFRAERDRIRRERDRARLEKKAAELEQKVLLMQMNPHFIFNALNTIKGYYSERNDDLAGTYITKFSRLLRLLLENAEQQIALTTEIQMLTLYIDLALIRYPDAFDYRIDSGPDLNRDEVAIPTLLLQPLIENAIIHGLAPKKTKGLLEVSFRRDGDHLVCTVQDDGIGRVASATRNRHRDHDGKAIEITRERLQLMAVTPGETTFKITDRYDENGEAAGTTVTLIIPFKTIW
ncbi:MAG TPA: histidine kinase, partial [Flavobacterium sp.]|nr:histidine kinase [Flavobacterium sp.]